ncbi:MAG TPA: protein-L-isoaspartate(D-aspartate) O-methyltransferase [Planctomycetaceae bacterium]|jgi:protein-L-isoaspartate(D-aspartate) O-methyltransferase|nr:protein-L-isoaspartate(D-aspartate) O-methyltransferase [Planctomycetaceae bacterium]
MLKAAVFVLLIGSQAVAPAWAQSTASYDRLRVKMVSESVEKAGVTDERVLEAMRRVPRHEFVPPTYRDKAYWDSAWPIGYKQTITWPSVVALMTQSLAPRPEDRVLEIGTGSGYQAAVLSLLVRDVYSIEILKPLGQQAEKRLKRLGYHNVKTKVGDGYAGWPEFAPFDKIIVTCSPERIPQPLIDQLAEGGRMIIPVGSKYDQEMCLLEKKKGKLVRKQLMPTYFVPMTGQSDKERTIKPDRLNPKIRNGGFEEREEDGQLAGWYNQRQLTLVQKDAPEGRTCVRFDNEEPGLRSNALQAIGVDGRKIGKLIFTFRCKAEQIRDGKDSFDKAGLQVIFDDSRHFVGDEVAANLVGSSPWQTIKATVKVPQGARQAVVRIGLNGATGCLLIDDVAVTAERRSETPAACQSVVIPSDG